MSNGKRNLWLSLTFVSSISGALLFGSICFADARQELEVLTAKSEVV